MAANCSGLGQCDGIGSLLGLLVGGPAGTIVTKSIEKINTKLFIWNENLKIYKNVPSVPLSCVSS